MNLTTEIKQIFFETLHNDRTISEFEAWVYADKELEHTLNEEDYLDFISYNYKNEGAKYGLYNLIERQIDLGEYEKWKLLKMLRKALSRDKDLPNLLMAFYDLYCRGYYFFDNLGLGYGLSIEVPYSLGAENWNDVETKEQKNLIDSFYPQIEREIEKVIYWLENKLVIPTGKKDELNRFEFIDSRSEEDKLPTAYRSEVLNVQISSKKWWKFWS